MKSNNYIYKCLFLIEEAIRNYQNICIMNDKIHEITLYRDKIPKKQFEKIMDFVNTKIRPMIFDMDYYSYLKDESYGKYNAEGHFIISSNRNLESIIWLKFQRSLELLDELRHFEDLYIKPSIVKGNTL